jgi:hypothetical protein
MQTRVIFAAAFLAVALAGDTSAQAAGAPPSRPRAAQPRVIVIPFTKEGESIRTVLEADFSRQVAVAKVKESFDARRFTTIDFLGAVRTLARDQGMAMASESDFRDKLLEQNQADVYVIANFQPAVADGLMSVTVILDAYMTANGMSLGAKTGRSPRNRLQDVAAHVDLVIEEVAPPFLDVVQQKFDEFQTEGVPLSINFRVAAGSATSFNAKPGTQTETLAGLLEDWIEKTAHNGGYNLTNATANMLQFSDVRLAIRDARGTPTSPQRFARAITAYLESIGVGATTSVSSGAIYVDVK